MSLFLQFLPNCPECGRMADAVRTQPGEAAFDHPALGVFSPSRKEWGCPSAHWFPVGSLVIDGGLVYDAKPPELAR